MTAMFHFVSARLYDQQPRTTLWSSEGLQSPLEGLGCADLDEISLRPGEVVDEATHLGTLHVILGGKPELACNGPLMLSTQRYVSDDGRRTVPAGSGDAPQIAV